MANPDRYDYDPNHYYYNEESDLIISMDDPSDQYDGDGDPVENDEDW